MKRMETKVVEVVYCDVCGEKVLGNYLETRADSMSEPQHACLDWNERLQDSCSHVLERRRKEELEKLRKGEL